MISVEVARRVTDSVKGLGDELAAVAGDVGQLGHVVLEQPVNGSVQDGRQEEPGDLAGLHRREGVQDLLGLFGVVEETSLAHGRHGLARLPHLLPQVASCLHSRA